MSFKFIFVEYGNKEVYFKELQYALLTLRSHQHLMASDVCVYTENAERYVNIPVTPISIKNEISEYSLNGRYHFRIKPMVIRRALLEHQDSKGLFFLDTDTYITTGLSDRLDEIKNQTILMNQFEKLNPYPSSRLENLLLPSGLTYSYTPKACMFNSGVLGILREHEPILVDAVAMIDGMLDAGFQAHTIEQCAVSEAFRIHGVQIKEVKKELVHYWHGSDKRYMHKKLDAYFAGATTASMFSMPLVKIPHSWWRARLDKFIHA